MRAAIGQWQEEHTELFDQRRVEKRPVKVPASLKHLRLDAKVFM